MPQTVHLQYNSPMGLYSKESAEEQYQQQIGERPSDLPAADKHFDPTKSATLKYLREGERENFGENFFEKVAQAEAPNVPSNTEPHWARTAREKSERARSKTPNDPTQRYRPSSSPAPSNHPIHYENAREHAEKNRVFTHNIHQPWGRSYYDAARDLSRGQRSHSAGRELLNRGYELGGMDFTGGIHVDHGTDYQYYEEPMRKAEPPKLPPGYELGGTDFYKGHVSHDPNYRGHGPDPPRLRPKYTADAHDPCNVAMAPNLNEVDANLLVGDTLSNQKIKHEVRHIDQSQFGTSFGPPQGFRRDHTTVHRQPEPAQPVIFSLSANKNYARSASVPRSSAPPDQRNVWNVQQDQDKEVSIRTLLNDEAVQRVPNREQSPYWANHSWQKQEAWKGRSDPRLDRYETYITEPNWRRNVDQRRLAWERRAFENEQRLSRPYSEKVAPGVPPAWHAQAEQKHRQWQQQADNMYSGYQQNYSSSQQERSVPVQHSPQPHYNQYESRQQQNTYSSSAQQQPPQQSYGSSQANENVQRLLNTGYNTNQVDYVLSHKDKYTDGPHYQPPILAPNAQASNVGNFSSSNQYSSSQYSNVNKTAANQQAIPLGGPTGGQNSSYSYTTETRVSGAPQQQQNYSNQNQNLHSSSYNTSSQMTKTVPVQQPASNYQSFNESKSSSSKKVTNTRTVPQAVVPIYRPQSFFEDGHQFNLFKKVNFENKNSEFEQKFNRDFNSPFSKTVPVTTSNGVTQASNYNKSYSSHTTTTQQQPVQVAPQSQNYSSSYHTEKNTTTTSHQPSQAIALPPPQNYSTSYQTETHSSTGPQMMHSPGGQSYKSTEFSSSRYNKQETTTKTTTQPSMQTITYPTTKTTTYNYSQQQTPLQQSQPAMHQESFTSHSEKNTSSSAPRPAQIQPASYQYENYLSSKKEESRREETSRPVSQLSQYSESRNYKRNYEEKTETTTVPAGVPASNVTYKDLSSAQNVDDVFNKKTEMAESLPLGSISNTHNNTEGGYRDANGHDVSYKRETQTSADPGKEYSLLKEEEKRVVETPLEPGVISRHVTTKYYKKKTVTDTTTTTTPS